MADGHSGRCQYVEIELLETERLTSACRSYDHGYDLTYLPIRLCHTSRSPCRLPQVTQPCSHALLVSSNLKTQKKCVFVFICCLGCVRTLTIRHLTSV